MKSLDEFLLSMGFRFSDKTEYLATHPEAKARWIDAMIQRIMAVGRRRNK
jgi:hypothetical protein